MADIEITEALQAVADEAVGDEAVDETEPDPPNAEPVEDVAAEGNDADFLASLMNKNQTCLVIQAEFYDVMADVCDAALQLVDIFKEKCAIPNQELVELIQASERMQETVKEDAFLGIMGEDIIDTANLEQLQLVLETGNVNTENQDTQVNAMTDAELLNILQGIADANMKTAEDAILNTLADEELAQAAAEEAEWELDTEEGFTEAVTVLTDEVNEVLALWPDDDDADEPEAEDGF